MSSFGKRSVFLACVGAISVPLVAAALAYGCTAVATLQVSKSAATAGSTISVSGRFFGTHDDATADTNSRVEIRLGSLTGPVLATAAPSGTDRSFTVPVTVPNGTPASDTFLAAIQKRPDGTNVYGTPARQALKVIAPPAPAPASGFAGGGSSGGITPTVVPDVMDTLTLAEARRAAMVRVRRSSPGARRIRARCSRVSRTRATCRVRWSSKGRARARRLVVNSQSSSSAW